MTKQELTDRMTQATSDYKDAVANEAIAEANAAEAKAVLADKVAALKAAEAEHTRNGLSGSNEPARKAELAGLTVGERDAVARQEKEVANRELTVAAMTHHAKQAQLNLRLANRLVDIWTSDID